MKIEEEINPVSGRKQRDQSERQKQTMVGQVEDR